MNNKTKISNQIFLYWVALFLAIGLRVSLLDSLPLNEFESTVAYQAHEISQGEFSPIEENASYVFITGILFTVFGSSDVLARLLPAVLGSFVIWTPYLFRKSIPQWAGVIAAFVLAIDPGLVPLSRIAGGSGAAIGFLILFVYFVQKSKIDIAGVFLSLFLFSGSFAFFGLFLVTGIWTLDKLFQTNTLPKWDKYINKPLFRSVLVSSILFGTYFISYPAGLSSLFSGIGKLFTPISLAGFTSIISGLFLSNPIIWLLTISFVLYTVNKKSSDGLPFAYWIISSLGFITIFESQSIHLAPWLIVPAWLLVSVFLAQFAKQGNLIVWGKTFVVFIFLLFFWINLQQFGNLSVTTPVSFSDLQNFLTWEVGTQNYYAHIIILFIIPGMILFTTYLFGTTWPRRYALRGLVWGISLFTLFLMVGSMVQASYYPQKAVNQVWLSGKSGGNIDIAHETIGNVSEYNVGTRNHIDVQSMVDLATLKWGFRNYPNFTIEKSIDDVNLPTIVITELTAQNIILESAYRGTTFAWEFQPAWVGFPPSIAKWMTNGEAPTISEQLIIWVKADAFPASESQEIEIESIIIPEEDVTLP